MTKNKTKRKTKNLQKQVWLHRICQIASLSLERFPQWASGKLSENHLVADANEPLWTPFPVCRCLWLSITFKMFKVEQIAQPVSFCWVNSEVDEEFLLFPEASRSPLLELWFPLVIKMLSFWFCAQCAFSHQEPEVYATISKPEILLIL